MIFKNSVFISLKIHFVIANSVDPDKMLHYAAFHLGLHCLPKYRLGVSSPQRFKGDRTRVKEKPFTHF